MNKDEFLRWTNGGKDLYEKILGKTLKHGKNTRLKNPFYEDTNGSLCINLGEQDKFVHYDFGDPHYKGDIFDFAGQKYGFDPKSSLDEIIKRGCEELGLEYIYNNSKTPDQNQKKVSSIKESIRFVKSTDPSRFTFWHKYGSSEQISKALEKYGVMAWESFQRGEHTITNMDYPIFAIPAGKVYKIYQPGHPEYKSSWYPKGAKDTNIFGLEQLPEKGEQVLIVEGPKDMIVAAAHGFNVVALDNAGTDPGAEIFANLTQKFNQVVLCLDNDSKGVEAMEKLSREYGLPYLVLPEKFKIGNNIHENWGSDISDFFALAEGFEQPYQDYFDEFLTSSLIPPVPSEIERILSVIEFDYNREIAKPVPVISIQDQITLTAGNISTLTGQSKSGKTGILSAIQSGSMKLKGEPDFDTCGLTIAPNTNKELLLHVDTEQSAYDYHKNVKKIFERTGRNRPPDWYKSFHFLSVDIAKRKEYLINAIEKYEKQFGGVYMIVVDGIGDFISSVNDEQESYQLVDWLFNLATDYNCPVLTVLHLNPGSDSKSRGHLGSHLERKSESVLTITKNGDVSTLAAKYLRNGGLFDPIQFSYDKEKGFHTYHGTKKEGEDQLKRSELSKLAYKIFKGEVYGLSAKELNESIQMATGYKERAAFTRMQDMQSLGIIYQDDDLHYKLVQKTTTAKNTPDAVQVILEDDLPF